MSEQINQAYGKWIATQKSEPNAKAAFAAGYIAANDAGLPDQPAQTEAPVEPDADQGDKQATDEPDADQGDKQAIDEPAEETAEDHHKKPKKRKTKKQ